MTDWQCHLLSCPGQLKSDGTILQTIQSGGRLFAIRNCDPKRQFSYRFRPFLVDFFAIFLLSTPTELFWAKICRLSFYNLCHIWLHCMDSCTEPEKKFTFNSINIIKMESSKTRGKWKFVKISEKVCWPSESPWSATRSRKTSGWASSHEQMMAGLRWATNFVWDVTCSDLTHLPHPYQMLSTFHTKKRSTNQWATLLPEPQTSSLFDHSHHVPHNPTVSVCHVLQ